MTSEWDGTGWAGTEPRKAEIGPGVGMIAYGTPLSVMTQSPQKAMWTAQLAYRENPWVRIAESAVTRKVAGLEWHFEDADDNEYDETAPDAVRAAMDLFPPKLIKLTSRWVGLCGMAYWYLDQQEQLAGTPLSLVAVNPARVWPAEDASGNLTGWVLDPKDDAGHGGTPLTTEELIPVYLDPPDAGHIGSGLYETARLKAHITRLADQHTAYVLSTGGRLPGVYSPKDGSIPDDKFTALVREFKNVASDPQAAKLSIVTQGPMDFVPAAASVRELLLVDLDKMNRDDILAIWGVPGSQVGLPTPAGLNSGGTKLADEAVLMQGAVHDRVQSIGDAAQLVLDRWAPLGFVIDVEIEEPEYDDRAPAFALLSAARETALTNMERRELIGLPPFDDPMLDNAIVLPASFGTYATAPGDGVMMPMGAMPMDAMPMKARTLLGLRKAIDTRWVPRIKADIAAALQAQRHAIAERVRQHGAHIVAKPGDTTVWWTPAEGKRLLAVLRPHMVALAEEVTSEARKALPAKADPFTESVLRIIATKVGYRVTDIDLTTRNAVADAIAQGFADGLSPREVGDVIEGLTTFDEYRSELIARTESAYAYNAAAIETYREYDVQLVEAIDGDEDQQCVDRQALDSGYGPGIYTIDDAAGIEDHPNGTLDWVPFFEAGKAVLPASVREVATAAPPAPPAFDWSPMFAAMATKASPEVHVHVPETVNLPSDVNIPAPQVTVNVDTESFAVALRELKYELGRPRNKEVLRDANGRIVGMKET